MTLIEFFSLSAGWITNSNADEATLIKHLHSLDGIDALGLHIQMPSGYLMISAAPNGRFTLSFLKAGSQEASLTLTDHSQSENETVSFMLDNGETDIVPARETVPLELVMKVAQHFIANDEVLDPVTTWIWAEPSFQM